MDNHSREVARRVNFDMQNNLEIRTGVPNDAYRDGWDRIFGKREESRDDTTTEEKSQ